MKLLPEESDALLQFLDKAAKHGKNDLCKSAASHIRDLSAEHDSDKVAVENMKRHVVELGEHIAALTAQLASARLAGARVGVECAAKWSKRQADSYEASRIENEAETAFASRCADARDVLMFAEKCLRAIPDAELLKMLENTGG